MLALLGCGKRALTVTLDRAEIQQRVNAAFPIEKEILLAKVTLENPEVILSDGSDQIGLQVRTRVSVPTMQGYSGKLRVSGKLTYRREQKAFYLSDATIQELAIDGISDNDSELVRKPIEALARTAFELLPVYELKSWNVPEVTAEYLLKSVSVQGGKVVAELGPPNR